MYRKTRSHTENVKHSGSLWEVNSQQPQIFIKISGRQDLILMSESLQKVSPFY